MGNNYGNMLWILYGIVLLASYLVNNWKYWLLYYVDIQILILIKIYNIVRNGYICISTIVSINQYQ